MTEKLPRVESAIRRLHWERVNDPEHADSRLSPGSWLSFVGSDAFPGEDGAELGEVGLGLSGGKREQELRRFGT